jgi:hypothetical protein
MDKVTLERKASGLRTVHGPKGDLHGLLDLNDLDLEDGEFEQMVQNYAERKRAKTAGDELVKQARAYAAKAGTTFSEALRHIGRENHALAERHRAQVLSDHG